MATVTSLGLHRPAGLRYAVDEEILPADAPPSSYTWDISLDRTSSDTIEDELLVTKYVVVWCRGEVFRKSFRFNVEGEPITQALVAFFPASEPSSRNAPPKAGTTPKNAPPSKRRLEKALVVFLKTQAHIYFLSGSSHVVHIPFEVESACAAPVGIIIQRKQRTENTGPVALKFPRVPPNSFVSSQITATSDRAFSQSTFSVEGLGNPKPLRLSLTLENMWEPRFDPPESRWPRLVCLTDPLLELGLVVTQPDQPQGRREKPRQSAPRSPYFLDPAEEILHVEEIKDLQKEGAFISDPLILATTVNRDTNTYTVWRLSYLAVEDPFLSRSKKPKSQPSRRRSSMQPGYASGATTPVHASFRDSVGAPLPGKRPRKSDKVDKPQIDLVVSSLESEREGVITRRQSRRVSSMLARADLSASQDRSIFSEQSLAPNNSGAKRNESFGSHHGKAAGASFHGQNIHPSLGSLLEAPVDSVLDELGRGGDFEGFHSMGLDDHDFDGLAQEMVLTKIKSIPVEVSNIRYSLSSQPATSQNRVFILVAPPYAVDDQHRTQILIGIQDPIDKRLQLLTLYYHHVPQFGLSTRATRMSTTKHQDHATVTCGQLRRAQSVVDSCKVEDGGINMILILSERQEGGHELSIQAPWNQLATISLPLLYLDNTLHVQYSGRPVDRDVQQMKTETIQLTSGHIVGLKNPMSRGCVDVVDVDGRLHQLRLQLQPSSARVRRVLDICRSVLPHSHGERVIAGWWHAMQWAQEDLIQVPDLEWTCLVVELFTIFLALADGDGFTVPKSARKQRRTGSRSFGGVADSADWKMMQQYETKNASAIPPWVTNRAWQWTLDEDLIDSASGEGDRSWSPHFVPSHIELTRKYMASRFGEPATGNSGYLPTAQSLSVDIRHRSASALFLSLHLLLEEDKLDVTNAEPGGTGSTSDLKVVLCQIARWLQWPDFVALYELGIQEEINPRNDSALFRPQLSVISQPMAPRSILEWIQARFTGVPVDDFPSLLDIYCSVSPLSGKDRPSTGRWLPLTPRTFMFTRFFDLIKPGSSFVNMVEAMHLAGINTAVLQTLPEAVLTPIQDALSKCRPHPPTRWTKELLELVNRTDISFILTPGRPRALRHTTPILAHTHVATWDFRLLCQSVEDCNNIGYEDGEGNERQAIIRALFKEDRRLNEAQDLLATHKSRPVRLEPHHTWSESEYLEKQKELVSRIAIGTLAIPAGRGLLYYGLKFPLLTQKFHIGGFNLNCVVKPANVTVGVDKALFTEEKVFWGFFHQGVAAGLAISPDAKGIDTSWILYNKPGQDLSNRHAGFLLALGLNGHLKNVAKWVAFKYLTPKHTMTSIGLLLGLAASYIGTMDSLITRLLSVHVTRMLPRGAAELNLSVLTQTSGIMGIGLLYCNSQHRRMSEIMMSEIEHIDEEDEEEPLRSEGYRLAAGFALGLINLGKGGDLKGLHDMKITEKLITIATGTKKVEMVHILDRASAAAVMAITLIYMKTEDHIVARKIDVPDTDVQFDYIRPDLLLLRTMAKNLILWSQIRPSFDWVGDNLPSSFRHQHMLANVKHLSSSDLPYFSVLGGLCFAIGLRFAGTANPDAREVLIYYLDNFLRICRIQRASSHGLAPGVAGSVYDEELTRSHARTCLDVVALSAASVMAGTGDLIVLRRLRSMHGRDDPETPYGSHLAAHLAIGALFLGCGTSTFGTSNLAIASLLISFYPMFPTSVMDNRSHLQAFRHFWVLATDPRCLVVKDIATGQSLRIPVTIYLKPLPPHLAATSKAPKELTPQTPCLLPPLSDIARIETNAGPDYWDIVVDLESNPAMSDVFSKDQTLYIRRRPTDEAPFTSTLRALGRTVATNATSSRAEQNPMEWIFSTPHLRTLTHAEQSIALDTSTVSATQDGATSSIVDARLELERGLDLAERDRLLGLQLLFSWGDKRDEFANGVDHEASFDERENGSGSGDWWMRSSVIDELKGKVWREGMRWGEEGG